MTTQLITYTVNQNGLLRVRCKQVPVATDRSRSEVTVNPKRPMMRHTYSKLGHVA